MFLQDKDNIQPLSSCQDPVMLEPLARAWEVTLASYPSVLRWGGEQDLIFWFHNARMIRRRLLRADFTTWVPGQHGLYFDAQNTLSCHGA